MKQIQPQNGCRMFVILEHVVTFESLINLLGFASTSILGYENNKRKRMAESKRKKEQRSTFSKLRRELVANKYRRRCSAQTLHYDPKNLKTVYETQKEKEEAEQQQQLLLLLLPTTESATHIKTSTITCAIMPLLGA